MTKLNTVKDMIAAIPLPDMALPMHPGGASFGPAGIKAYRPQGG